jgi:hypothetical protein
MPSATSPLYYTPPYLPAWQRLGLKLKSAQQSDIIGHQREIVTSTSKRKTAFDHTPSTKRAKTTKFPASTSEPITPQLKRKKSVTFTPETKVEDGDSIKQLFNSWVTEQKAEDPAFGLHTSNQVFDTPVPRKVYEQFDTNLDEKERRVKRIQSSQKRVQRSAPLAGEPSKKSKSAEKKTNPPKIVNAAIPTPPFLSYIKQYCKDRANWKFNKNHQSHLLKHIFDLKSIPSDQIHLAYGYIASLQGGVRTRLRDEALAIQGADQELEVGEHPETMSYSLDSHYHPETPEEKAARKEKERQKLEEEKELARKEYVATMTQIDASKNMGYEEGVLLNLSDFAMKERVAKRVRANIILTMLGRGATLEDAEAAARPKDSGLTYPEAMHPPELRKNEDSQKKEESGQKVSRKRKRRTRTYEKSSSSSSSNDTDDSSSDESRTTTTTHTLGNTTTTSDSTSSSSSSSSSSGSSNDSEDDSEDDSEEDSEDVSEDTGNDSSSDETE